MAARSLTASDVVTAIQQQNTQVAAGQLGQPPIDAGQAFQITMSTMGRLSDVEQFAENDPEDRRARTACPASDVASIELGAQAYDQACTLNGSLVALSSINSPVRTRWKSPSGCGPEWKS